MEQTPEQAAAAQAANEPWCHFTHDIQADGAALLQDQMLLEDILGNIYLYIDWKYISKQLTTEQKNRFADAVTSWSTRLNEDSLAKSEPLEPERWWVHD